MGEGGCCWVKHFCVIGGLNVQYAAEALCLKWSSALWSCGVIAADSMPRVSIGMKHILNTLSFHYVLMLLFFQNL